jgi:Na+-translocating ferredoxin:NAD+ oxidoreductase subunit C
MVATPGRLHGGLRLPGHKQAAEVPIRACPLPALLQLPLQEGPGPAAEPLFTPGTRVRAGDCVARGTGPLGVAVHAPCAGVLGASHQRPADGELPPQVLLPLQPDGSDEAHWLPPLDPTTAGLDVLHERVREAGILGLGGAGFPTADKLAATRELLILNGAECEPHIACDDRLLRERTPAVLQGGLILQRLCGAEQVIVAVEDSMTAAAEALRTALPHTPAVELQVVPTLYPQGGERQLISTLTGREVPSGGLPRDLGIVVFNVGTAYAVWQAVVHGRPLTHRLVSVSGSGVAQPGVFEVAIGTPAGAVVAAAGGYTDSVERLVLGGPLMGRALPDDAVPIGKTSNALVALAAGELRPPAPALPCIRCGDCAAVCPPRLLPQQLHAFANAGDEARLRDFGLFDCIDCGACDLVCPSQLPLAAQFRHARASLRAQALQRERADAARERFLQRGERLQREAAERAQQQAERQRGLTARSAAQEALARARAKREGGE